MMIWILFSMLLIAATPGWACNSDAKQQLIAKATDFKGQSDPDRSKQQAMEVLVKQLLVDCPPAPLAQRLPLISGAWQQVWGPYTYRDRSRGVDKTLDPNNIYQVVFPEGFYYNVSPDRDSEGKSKNRTVLLRGEYRLDEKDPTRLSVKFTNLQKLPGEQADPLTYGNLPQQVVNQQLQPKNILPGWFVRLIFGGGSLQEVYTDDDLRITYGSSKSNLKNNYIYVLKRVK